jgi:hypothetical protein
MHEPGVNEAAIRDEIALRPELIELGLATVGKNYHLRNSEGTRGFIDVLARDRHGLFVVIEVKRSDSTAREAIHEVLKYCELLRSERGLRRDQVRAVIASTTWRELLVPFSEMSRVTDYPIEGVELTVDAGFPASLKAQRITPIPVPPERDLSALAVRFEVESVEAAVGMWPEIVARLLEVGVDDALGIVAGNSRRTVLHVALGTVVDGDPRVPTPHPHEDEERGDEGEYRAASQFMTAMGDGELVGPERLRRIMVSNQMEVLQVLRSGRFEGQIDLVDDAEAVRLAEGRAGWNQVMVTLTGKPSHALAWRRLRTRLEYSLLGNPRWNNLLGLWLDEIEANQSSADVVLDVYNPCDLMAALVHGGLGGNLSELIPKLTGGLDVPGDDGRLLHGDLTWDGTPASTAVAAIESVYPEPVDWGMARASGGVWEKDLELLESLGLHYDLFEFMPGDADNAVSRLEEREGILTREPASAGMAWPGRLPFPEWLREVDLNDLLAEYRSSMVPVNGGDQWLHFQGPREGGLAGT